MMIKIGIPRSLFYFYYKDIWINFFKELGIDIVISPKTNKEIINLGMKYATDEMCLSLKNYIGHVAYLKDKCEYILIPRIDNYGSYNQTCTNFLAIYDYINNIFDIKLLNYNVDLNHKETENKGLINLVTKLGISKKKALYAYDIACMKNKKVLKEKQIKNYSKLNDNRLKILLVGHSYNISDEFIGIPIIKLLKNMNISIIYSDQFDSKISNDNSCLLTPNNYWKYSKEIIGPINLVKNKINGIIFLSTFPCGVDSLANELVMRNISIPYLNIIIDDLDSLSGIETRMESFIDIIHEKVRIDK